MRALAGIRQSKKRELSESPETQRKGIGFWADQQQHTLVGEAVDIGVSASVSPFKRRELGLWLTDPELLALWDILAVWKVDRVVRDLKHFYGELVPKLEQLGKKVVSVTEGIDTMTSSPIEIAMRVSLAQEELTKLKDRSRSSRDRLREAGRWHGGIPYFGFEPARTPEGMKLAIDQDALGVVDAMRDMVKLGNNLHYLTGWLNQEGIRTAWDRHEIRMGRKPKGRLWRRPTVAKMLTSRTLLGQMTHKGEVIRDEKGNPLQFGEPLMTRAEWDELQGYLDKPKEKRRRAQSSPLLRVAYCNDCGRTMYHHPQTAKDQHRRYYCSSRAVPPRVDCEAVSFKADELEAIVEELYLDRYGDQEIVDVTAVATVDYRSKIGELDEQIANLAAGLGAIKPGPAHAAVIAELNKVQAERDELEQASKERQGVKYTRTGRSYRQEWQEADKERRLDLLRQHGVYVMVQQGRGGVPNFIGMEMGHKDWTYTSVTF